MLCSWIYFKLVLPMLLCKAISVVSAFEDTNVNASVQLQEILLVFNLKIL